MLCMLRQAHYSDELCTDLPNRQAAKSAFSSRLGRVKTALPDLDDIRRRLEQGQYRGVKSDKCPL